eukprot:UN01054
MVNSSTSSPNAGQSSTDGHRIPLPRKTVDPKRAHEIQKVLSKNPQSPVSTFIA